LLNTKVMFISHMHADHVLGTLRILQERDALLDPLTDPDNKLYVVVPQSVYNWVDSYRTKHL